jgi:uncharacterized damage-inducible protein DinB
MVNIRDLLAYNEAERRAFFKAFSEMSWREFTKNREASFHSIRNIFIHTLNNTDSWLDLLQNKKQRSKKKFGEYKTLKEIETYMQQVEKHMHDYLETLSSQDLKKKYELEGLDGKPEMKAAEDILVHVFEDEVHHRGELIALFWQMGIEPPVIYYARQSKNSINTRNEPTPSITTPLIRAVLVAPSEFHTKTAAVL